jgi:NAD(P)-dependent dehydrogenase (short-subunit alcohol dehydrogenase family)
MAKALAQAGANVVIIGRRKEAGQAVADEIQKAGGKAMSVQADVLQLEDLKSAKEKILSAFGTIDILVNAAGGNMPDAVVTPTTDWTDLDMDAYSEVVNLNLQGTVLPSKIFGAGMAKRKSGVIINIASVASSLPLTQVAAYSQAKAAIKSFTQWLAVEMATKYGERIRVNAIAPGFFLAEQNRKLLLNEDGSYTARGNKAIIKTPFGRFGNPEELNGTLIWLCSNASTFVTGAVVPVDGGFTAFSGV